MKSNPLGFRTIDLVLLAGGAWFIMSDRGKQLLSTLFPGTGIQYPGVDPGVGVPLNTQFRIERADSSSVLFGGGDVSITFQIGHIGPSGSYTAIFEMAPANLLCLLGSHGTPIFSIEIPFNVDDDSGWRSYTVQGSQTFTSQPHNVFDIHGGVRDSVGRMLTSGWACGSVLVF